jgi:hypothetical protein
MTKEEPSGAGSYVPPRFEAGTGINEAANFECVIPEK